MPSLIIHHRTASVPTTIKKHYHAHRATNRLLPILTIYPDLLEYIFHLGLNSRDTLYQRQRTVLSYSHTCHDWRLVALSIKSIWATLIDFELNSEAWNKELLRRSHPSPIVLGSKYFGVRHFTVISAELLHLERIRIYNVGFDASAWDILLERLQHPAPLLEYLRITHFMCRNAVVNTRTPFILPSTLFAGDAPCLKGLELTQCLVDFTAPALRSLTMLTVILLPTAFSPTPLEWLDHLSHLPFLTSLSLKASMRSQGDHYTLRTDKIKLSNLSVLDLDDTLHDIHILIDGLNFPVDCSMLISCSRSYTGPALDTIMTAYLHRLNHTHILRPDNCPFFIYATRHTKLFISNDPSDGAHHHYDDALDSHDHTRRFPNSYLNFYFGFAMWESLFASVLSILRDAFSHFTSLSIQLPATHPDLLPCLFRATKLTHLVSVSAAMTKNLLSQIQIIRPSSSSSIPLPALHTIIFTDDSSMWGAPYQSFTAFLTWRQSIGYPLERVLFRRCMILDDTIVNLEMLGVQVECDSSGSRWERL